QARGQWERIDGRTDIYGLGAVLYAVLTGEPPHPGVDSDESLEHARMGLVKPPRAHCRSIPRDLERVVIKALEADPAQRYATVHEFRKALMRCRFPYRYRTAVLAGALIMAIAVGLLVMRQMSGTDLARPVSLGPQAHRLIKVDRGGRELLLNDAVPL